MKIKRHLTHYADRHRLLKTTICQFPRKQKKKVKKARLELTAKLAEMCESNIILSMENFHLTHGEFISYR